MTSRRRGLRRGGKGKLAERYFVRSGTVYLGTTQNMRCTVTARWSAIDIDRLFLSAMLLALRIFIFNALAVDLNILFEEHQTMKKATKIITFMLVLSVLAGCIVALTACNDSKDKDNQLVVGLECAYIPFNFTQQTDANDAVK